MNEPNSPSRIILCEDERIVALDIRAFLQRNGYEVPAIYAAAEDLLKEAEVLKPDLVLMDIHLQGAMDGIEAAAILLERWAIPVILLTAYADGPTIERAKLTHPYAYILKPYDERELKTAISIGLYRASMEHRLRRSEERYRSLFQDGIAATMLVESGGRILESNKACARLAPGLLTIQEFLYDEAESDLLSKAMLKGAGYGPSEIRVRRPDGQESWALLSAAPIELPDGTSAFQCQAVDVTERKTLMDQLVHAQKLSALGRFAGGVAHDFNNVLTAVLGYAHLLRSDFEVEGRGLQELDGIEQAAKRAAALSRQLLMFSRRDETRPSIFKLSDLACDNERMLKRIVGDTAHLVVHPFDGDDSVLADRSRIELAVVNLVANARDAMPDGGRILLVTGVLHIEAELPGALEPIPAGAWSFIEVIDKGTGMTPETMTKIFQPFFTTKPPDRGTGLGLSTVVSIVRQAQGRIVLSSNPGEGTTMQLLFPRTSSSEALAVDETAGTQPARTTGAAYAFPFEHRNRTAMLVVNDDSVRAIVEALLDRAGYRIASASQPGEALLLAEKSSNTPDILVADCVMPLMTGPELASRLRSTFPDLPALYLRGTESTVDDAYGEIYTGTAAPADPRTPHSLRDVYLDKPFREEELVEAMDSMLRVTS